jgi:putative FmdB family regulatory protein
MRRALLWYKRNAESKTMPIYEYQCKSCARRFETLRSIRDASSAPCPGCGSVETARQLSLIAQPARGSGGESDFLANCAQPDVCGPGGG